jgi:hypothetical protein
MKDCCKYDTELLVKIWNCLEGINKSLKSIDITLDEALFSDKAGVSVSDSLYTISVNTKVKKESI